MANPWLQIPLADYEGHMQSAGVEQLAVLSRLFGEVLHLCKPASVAILGVAGGNGLEHIDSSVTGRIAGVDLNPEYLAIARERFSHLQGLELHCVDLSISRLRLAPLELVHAALVFEHAGVGLCLENALSLVAPGGVFSVILQLPSEISQGVAANPFASIQLLKPNFALIDVAWFRQTIAARGFVLSQEATHSLAGGKSFWAGCFARDL